MHKSQNHRNGLKLCSSSFKDKNKFNWNTSNNKHFSSRQWCKSKNDNNKHTYKQTFRLHVDQTDQVYWIAQQWTEHFHYLVNNIYSIYKLVLAWLEKQVQFYNFKIMSVPCSRITLHNFAHINERAT